MWTQPCQSMLVHLLLQSHTFHLFLLPTRQALAAPIWTTRPNTTGHRIQPRRTDLHDQLVMPIDLSILRSVPQIHVPDTLQERPVLLAVNLAALHGRELDTRPQPDHHAPESRARNRGDSVRNDIVLIPDLTMPARIKNEYVPSHRLNARVASLGNDRIPVFDHLYAPYGQGQAKDALWDFLEDQIDEDNHLVPGPSDYDYPEDYGLDDEEPYWYHQGRYHEDEYEGSDNKIKSPQQFRNKKDILASKNWRPEVRLRVPPSHKGLLQGPRKAKHQEYQKPPMAVIPSLEDNRWRSNLKKSHETESAQQGSSSKWTWTRGGKKNIFFTAGWGPGGRKVPQPQKDPPRSPTTEEEKGPTGKQPPWRKPIPMWGVPHLFGPYW